MRLYITGATGFVGRAVVARALEQGHDVTAVVRPASPSPDGSDGPAGSRASGSLTEARVDLRSRRGLAESLAGADAVIHLAAAKAGDFATQFAGTVVATENLLAAMVEAGVTDLVGVSTFSVYDYRSLPAGSVIDEDTPIDASPARRDEYARTKLVQEGLYRRFGEDGGHRVVIVRPGMIYGPGNLWHALLGAELGPRFLRIGSRAVLPLTYVENCAEALVLAAERLRGDTGPTVDGAVINIVDDDLPTQQTYADAVAARTDTPPAVTVPWPLLRAAAGLLETANRVALDGRAKFPGIAVPDRLDARFKPFRYSNRRARELLGWTPRHDLATALDRSVSAERRAAEAAG